MIRQKQHILPIFLMALFLLFAFVLYINPLNHTAYADSFQVTYLYAECVDFDGEIVEYDGQYYARGISVYFEVMAPYYTIVTYNSLGEEIYSTNPLEPDANNIAKYDVTRSGALTIRCYATDSQGVIQEVYDEIQIRSDNLSPQEPTVSQMTEWVRYENGFLVQISLNQDNGSAGIYKADIKIIYDDQNEETRTILSPNTNDAFLIDRECTVVIAVYDYVGNSIEKSYRFDLFDSMPPPVPVFILTPNIEPDENTNGYVRNYFVTIDYGEDDKSGILLSSRKYTINGVLFDYEGGFYLSEQKKYTLTAYCQDNAQNPSEKAEINIENIDTIEPIVNDMTLHIDLTKSSPYTIRINCADSMSGIEKIEAVGIGDEFKPNLYNWYEYHFDILDVSSIVIKVYDNVGNVTQTNLLAPNYSNFNIIDLARDYNELFLTLNQDDYSQAAWLSVLNLYDALSIMLMAKDTSMSDFDYIKDQIDKAVSQGLEFKYVIRTVPEGIRTAIEYQMSESHLPNYKRGDTVTLFLDESSPQLAVRSNHKDIARRLANFDKCMAFPFMLSFAYNGEIIDYEFDAPVTIAIPVPYGYEARYFEIIDLENEVILESETINNQVIFEIDKGGVFAFIIEGEEISLEPPKPRGVKVFGRYVSLGAFIGIIVGVTVLAVGLIVMVTKRYRKQK